MHYGSMEVAARTWRASVAAAGLDLVRGRSGDVAAFDAPDRGRASRRRCVRIEPIVVSRDADLPTTSTQDACVDPPGASCRACASPSMLRRLAFGRIVVERRPGSSLRRRGSDAADLDRPPSTSPLVARRQPDQPRPLELEPSVETIDLDAGARPACRRSTGRSWPCAASPRRPHVRADRRRCSGSPSAPPSRGLHRRAPGPRARSGRTSSDELTERSPTPRSRPRSSPGRKARSARISPSASAGRTSRRAVLRPRSILTGGLTRRRQRAPACCGPRRSPSTSLATASAACSFAARHHDRRGRRVVPPPSPSQPVASPPTPSADPSTTRLPSPSAEPTPAVTSPPVDPTLDLESFAVTRVDQLRVRAQPTVAESSAKLEPLLRAGVRLFVIEEPVAADGYAWYHVAVPSRRELSLRLGRRGEPRRLSRGSWRRPRNARACRSSRSRWIRWAPTAALPASATTRSSSVGEVACQAAVVWPVTSGGADRLAPKSDQFGTFSGRVGAQSLEDRRSIGRRLRRPGGRTATRSRVSSAIPESRQLCLGPSTSTVIPTRRGSRSVPAAMFVSDGSRRRWPIRSRERAPRARSAASRVAADRRSL